MIPISTFGRFLVVAGVVLIVLGLLLSLGARLPRLPGDLLIERPGVTVWIPLGTMVVLSVALTVALNLLFRR